MTGKIHVIVTDMYGKEHKLFVCDFRLGCGWPERCAEMAQSIRQSIEPMIKLRDMDGQD